MLGPYPIEAVIEQLRTASALRIVGGAADLETAKTQPPRNAPAAYALRHEAGERLGDYTGQLRQRLRVTVIVVLWVRHAGTADTGAKAEAEMTAVENAVRTALLGFKPASEPYSPLWLRVSGNDQYAGNHLVRQVLFECDYLATGDAP